MDDTVDLDANVWLRLQLLDLAAYFTDDQDGALAIAASFERYCLQGTAPRDNVRNLKRVESPIG